MNNNARVIVFDDVVILPSLAKVEPSQVRLDTYVTSTNKIKLSVPIISSPMDTVTESTMAIKLGLSGGLGTIHRNMSIESQLNEVLKVKQFEARDLMDYYTNNTSSVRIVRENNEYKVVIERLDAIDFEQLAELSSAYKLLREYGAKPTLDSNGRIAAAAAVSPFDEKRIKALDGVADILITDVAHAHNLNVISSLKRIAQDLSSDLVVGNLGTKQGVLDLLSMVEEVKGLRVGISSGSICSTGQVTGAAAPTLWAVMQAREALEELGLQGKIPIIADGGIRNGADIAKSIIAGASAVMVGRLLAGTKESPGPVISIGGNHFKQYRGMASPSAVTRRYAADRYGKSVKKISEGVEGLVPYKGSVVTIIEEIVFTLQASLGYAGASNITEAWRASLGLLSESAKKEVQPHDLLL